LVNHTGAKIHRIDFRLAPGQCIGIIGESGSGKSTLAKLLVGLLIPSEGSVRLNNHLIDFDSNSEIRLLRSKVQLVMQDGRGSLHPHKTIRWLFDEVLAQRKKTEKELNLNLKEVLSEVGLPEQVLDRSESSLSGGECLRACIARALLMQPEILICDESTTSLDEMTKDGIVDLLVSLMKNQHLALILISHDDTIIRRIANDILVFDRGEIVEHGNKDVIINNPKHPVTQKIFAAHATLSSKK
jgi:peptide/nickel transport system ATP-binding protein